MAARRLIIVLVVLFVASVIAAAIAPERGPLVGDETATTVTTDPTTTESTDPSSAATTSADATTTDAAQHAKVDPSPRESEGRTNMRLAASAADPPTGKAVVGEQLELVVTSDRFLQLEIPAFGMTANASPNAPARFSLLLRDAGELPVLAARDGKTVARLQVTSTRRRPPNER